MKERSSSICRCVVRLLASLPSRSIGFGKSTPEGLTLAKVCSNLFSTTSSASRLSERRSTLFLLKIASKAIAEIVCDFCCTRRALNKHKPAVRLFQSRYDLRLLFIDWDRRSLHQAICDARLIPGIGDPRVHRYRILEHDRPNHALEEGNSLTGRQMPDLMHRQLAALNEDALQHLRILQSEREP
jgi:hypothetical protein